MKKLALLLISVSLIACLPSKNQGLPPELLDGAVEALEKETETPLETEVSETNQPKSVVSLETNKPSDDQCNLLAKGLVEAFEDVNYCEEDSDCRVAPGACPFGCYYLYNDSLNFDSYAQDIESYKTDCKSCTYECEDIKTLSAPKCIDKKCVIL